MLARCLRSSSEERWPPRSRDPGFEARRGHHCIPIAFQRAEARSQLLVNGLIPGGRKLLVTPDGAPWAPRPRVDNAMVKALARAFRCRRKLDEGVHATLEDLARAEGVAPSYASRSCG